jgi:hypothetical protein
MQLSDKDAADQQRHCGTCALLGYLLLTHHGKERLLHLPAPEVLPQRFGELINTL